IVGNFGIVEPHEGFLKAINDLTHDVGALVIYDEIITAFRFTYGSAQQIYGVEPDMTAMGKLLAVDYRLVLTEDEKILWNRLLPSDPHIRPEQWQATQLPWRQELPVWKYCKQMGFMKSLNNSANVWKRVSWKKQISTAFLLLLIDYEVH